MMPSVKAKTKRTNRTEVILVRLKPDERKKMEAAAKAKGLAVSAWLRMAGLSVLNKDA